MDFINALNLTAVTYIPDMEKYWYGQKGPGWEAMLATGEVIACKTRESAQAARIHSVKQMVSA